MDESNSVELEDKLEIEIEDDTPPQDRGREPLPKELVEELEKDELEDYDEQVKIKLKQMKKVWHDERREKERALREHQVALEMAKQLQSEVSTLRSRVTQSEGYLVDSVKNNVENELKEAEQQYKDAYEAGDSDKLLEAHRKLTEVNSRLDKIKNYTPPVLSPETNVNYSSQPQAPQLDPKTDSWRRQNTWFGSDDEMTASALGLHQKLLRERGAAFEGTDEYWNIVDNTMRKRFPEFEWGDEKTVEPETKSNSTRTEKPATVVAPVSRSTTSRKVRLNQSQLNVIKKMGITPEQYVKEMMKLERANG